MLNLKWEKYYQLSSRNCHVMIALAMSVMMRCGILGAAIEKSRCECGIETRQVKPPEEELEIEMEVDNGCFENVCCFLHASKK